MTHLESLDLRATAFLYNNNNNNNNSNNNKLIHKDQTVNMYVKIVKSEKI